MHRDLAVAVLLTLATVLQIVSLEAGTYTVTTLDDHDDGYCDSDCTLREAIKAAQFNCWDAVDLINFDQSLSGTIYLNSELPHLTCPMVLDGGGRVALSGSNTVGYGLIVYAWDGSGDPDITVRGLSFEGFARAGVMISPFGQVLIEGVEVRSSNLGLVIYSTSASARVTLRGLEVHGNSGQGLYVVPSDLFNVGEAGIRVERSRFHSNYQGILVHGVKEIRNVMIGDPSNSDSGNYVYGNEAEGILLSGSVIGAVIAHNSVGTDGSLPKPNLLGGVVLADGVRESTILSNEVAYNGYQNILLMGSGTELNSVEGNYVHCDPTLGDPLCYVGIWIGRGASANTISGNVISGHKYEGVALLGEADDNVVEGNRVGSFNRDGSYNGDRNVGNGAGIAVINAAAPDINYPFPVYAKSPSADIPGPERVVIRSNIVAGNRGAGVILIRAVGFEAYGNMVYENSFHGFYWVGSSGVAHSNTVYFNDGSGFRVEPYWGLDSPSARATSPSTHGDDVLSSATSDIGIYGNYVEYNKGYGLLIIDNPWADLGEVGDRNYFFGNEPLEAAKLWLGHVRVVGPGGDPVAGLTVDVFRGGDDSDSSPDYSCSTGADGRCGPPGFDHDDASTWFMIVEEELANAGQVVRRYNPHGFALAGREVNALYYWNGLSDVGESGGSIESPPGSGAFRYQYARLVYAARVGETAAVECYVRSELNATSPEYPLSPGGRLNYTLKLTPSCSRPLEVEAVMRVPEGLSPLVWYSPVGELSYDNRSRLIRWKGVISGNATVLEVAALVSSGARLGEPILMRANLTCLSPNCIAYRSDDPATPTWEDHTLRPVSLVTIRTPPSRELRVPFNLSPYGEFSLFVSGCDDLSLSFGYPVENGSVLSNPSGVLSAISPRRVSSCEVKFALVRPSSLSRPLFESNLSHLIEEFLIRIEVIPEVIEPELKVEVRPKELVLGKPFAMRLTLVNPSGFDLNASLRIPLDRLKLLSVVHSTHGEIKRIGRDLLWSLELPAGRNSSAQLTLIPEAEGELSLILKLLYSAGGPEYERTVGLHLRVSREAAGSFDAVKSAPLTTVEPPGGDSVGSPMASPSEPVEVTERGQGVEAEASGGLSSAEHYGPSGGRELGEDPISPLVTLILASILAALAYSAIRR